MLSNIPNYNLLFVRISDCCGFYFLLFNIT